MATPRLHARPPADPAEQRTLRKLAAARQAPASWVQRARIITGSWDGASVTELAERLGCRTKSVYKWLSPLQRRWGGSNDQNLWMALGEVT